MNQAVNLNEQVRGMQDMLQRALGELARLQIDAAPDMWCVEVDPNQLEASILNLAVNARDAMPDGGTLVLETRTGVLDDNFVEKNPDVTPGQYAVLRVRDSGHGMGPDTTARVLEPFFTTKEVGRGTGLELSMVYGFVKLFTSGYPRDHQASNQLGRPIAVLPKPFTRIDLARAVRGNLDEYASH